MESKGVKESETVSEIYVVIRFYELFFIFLMSFLIPRYTNTGPTQEGHPIFEMAQQQ
jgi:hypothetical protein